LGLLGTQFEVPEVIANGGNMAQAMALPNAIKGALLNIKPAVKVVAGVDLMVVTPNCGPRLFLETQVVAKPQPAIP
tara:strand:- start:243 stop:470 length:228 start_codon:yes stop_codon:yes gene_type:complete